MKTENLNDGLETEHDLTKLTIRRVEPVEKTLQEGEIRLDADVAKIFSDSKSVNEALRFLIKITKEHQAELS